LTKTTTTNEDDFDGTMNLVGSVSGIGSGERIYAARFIGDKAYIVTFRQIDPFYTLDLADPFNPTVVGELKISGFSNYLHPVSDDLILGLGQDADPETGMQLGLQISLFDVSDFAHPQLVRKNQNDLGQYSGSEAQYDHKAFRYLPESRLLILPLYVPGMVHWPSPSVGVSEFFDGFVVYDVDHESNHKYFEIKFNISHVSEDQTHLCWSEDSLPSRSLVFNGTVMTLKRHKVYSHELESEVYLWDINLDEGKSDDCYGWIL